MVNIAAVYSATIYGEEAVAFCEEVFETARFAVINWSSWSVADIQLHFWIACCRAAADVFVLLLTSYSFLLALHFCIEVGQVIKIAG